MPFQPDLPEEVAVDIAYQHGVVMVEDIDPTLDADWRVEGRDAYGHEIELIIDGRTGAIESAEMEND